MAAALTVLCACGSQTIGLSRALAAPAAPNLDPAFVANAGELDSRVAYYAATRAGGVYVAHDGEITYAVPASILKKGTQPGAGWALKESFIGARRDDVRGRDATALQVRHLDGRAGTASTGSSAAVQRTYRWVDLGEPWPGVTAHLHARDRDVEQLFEVAPGANPAAIRLRMRGASCLGVAQGGALEVCSGIGTIAFSAPRAWQEVDGRRHAVGVRYRIVGPDRYGFAVGRHDPRRAVVIDPILQATYLGGTGGGGAPTDQVAGLAVDQATGDVYAVGTVGSTTGFPVSAGAIQTTEGTNYTPFIARIAAD